MLAKLDERLMQVKVRVRSKQKLESMLRQAQNVLQEEKSKCSTLKGSLVDEKSDVDKLEGLSLTGLFYSVLGTKEETLEKERQEFLAAKLKYEVSVKSLNDSQQEVCKRRRGSAAGGGEKVRHRDQIKARRAAGVNSPTFVCVWISVVSDGPLIREAGSFHRWLPECGCGA